MLCPNTQAATNGYAAGSVRVQDHLFPKRFEIWIRRWEKMYTKRGGPTPFIIKIPRNLDLWMGKMEKKCMKRKENNVGLCPLLPMTRKNTDLGMGKCEKHLSEKCEKQMFVLTSF